jgi:hypothetical protein
MGLEARIGARISVEGNAPFSVVSHTWILPVPDADVFFIVLSSPGQTHFLSIPQSPEDDEFHNLQAVSTVGLDMQHSTLAVAMIAGNCVLQITESAISLSRNAQDSLLIEQWPAGHKVVAAAIENNIACAIIALRIDGRSEIRALIVDDVDETASISELGSPVRIEGEVISLAIHSTSMLTFVVAGDSNGTLHIFRVSPRNGLEPYLEHEIPQNPDHLDDLEALNTCEDILVLGEQTASGKPTDLVVLCGLRGGSIYALELHVGLDGKICAQNERDYG